MIVLLLHAGPDYDGKLNLLNLLPTDVHTLLPTKISDVIGAVLVLANDEAQEGAIANGLADEEGSLVHTVRGILIGTSPPDM